MRIQQILVFIILVSLFGIPGSWQMAQAADTAPAPEIVTAYTTCTGAPSPRLMIGGQGRVTPGLPNRLRHSPTLTSPIMGRIPGGAAFSVMYGPTCANGMNWWQVNYNGLIGWTAEGYGSSYWLEPLTAPTCANAPAPRLTAGGQGRVTPGLPNNVRSQPYSSSTYVGQIPSGGVFTVLEGPNCGSNIIWWKVNYNGMIGWTGEGTGSQYWVEPVASTACSISPLPRLTVGATAQVTPGLPNTLRSQPTASSTKIGEIPGSSIFTVLEGPTCHNNMGWWKVNYNGVIGWTAEGQGSTYWLTPLQCWNSPAPRLIIGKLGRVTPNGLSNALRSAAGTGSNSYVTGSIPSGGVFTVLAGPQCGNDGRAWWQVNYNGLIGWTAEGSGTTYWLEPLQ